MRRTAEQFTSMIVFLTPYRIFHEGSRMQGSRMRSLIDQLRNRPMCKRRLSIEANQLHNSRAARLPLDLFNADPLQILL